MATLRILIEGIIKDWTELQPLPAVFDKDDNFGLPRSIFVGNDRSIGISRGIDESIATVAEQWMASNAILASRFTQAELTAAVRAAFGPALAGIDLADKPSINAKLVLADVKAALGLHVSSHGARELAFGCTLFGNATVKPFAIGPVQFESRLQWLERKHREGSVSAITRRRIERIWSGIRLRKRKRSAESVREMDILTTVDACRYVCSVTVDGLGAEAGRDRALTAARLATVAIALLWRTPSRALEGLNLLFDRSPHRQNFMTLVPGKAARIASRWSHMPYGGWLKAGEWEQMFSKRQGHFGVVASVLHYVLAPSGGVVARPNMMNTLVQALLSFHEGCREPWSLMAIVKFAASLDALACGGESGGIRRLITARLGLADDTPVRSGGPTMKQAVEQIYSDGRSRTIHGTQDRLGKDWTQTRALAEQLCRLCLILCIDWVAKNPSSDDPKQLSK